MRHAIKLFAILLMFGTLVSGFGISGFGTSGFVRFAYAEETRIVIREGRIQPIRIALMPIVVSGDAASAETKALAHDFRKVIETNLENSALFISMAEGSFPQTVGSMYFGPDFELWWERAIPVLVYTTLKVASEGRIRLEVRLWDTFSGEEKLSQAYGTGSRNWRRAAHIISDDIYKTLKGEEGYFDSRIVYVSEQWKGTQRVKRLAMMDQDGANHRYLTDGEALVLTPRFSPTSQQITYLSYRNDVPQVFVWDILTQRKNGLGKFPGMTFAPRFSYDGQSIAMSLARNGNTDIYTMNLKTRRLKRVTRHPGIDTAPSFSPNGRYITFESDRSGHQQIYVLDLKKSKASRISWGEGRYATPVWSPRGDLIAYTRLYKGRFYIGVMKPDGSDDRALTSAYHAEGPTWAPNGRLLMYFKEPPESRKSGGSKLYSIDLTGHNERLVTTPFGGSDPAWSPLLR